MYFDSKETVDTFLTLDGPWTLFYSSTVTIITSKKSITMSHEQRNCARHVKIINYDCKHLIPAMGLNP